LDNHLRANGTPVYALFIDFKAAFNTASRTAIVNTLAELGVTGYFLRLISLMLAPNLIRLFDGVRVLPEFVQDTGLPQGDTIASLLFVVLLIHLPAEIKCKVPGSNPELYADDLLILAMLLSRLGEAASIAKQHAAERGLEINWEKSKVLKFRRGGPMAASDTLNVDGVPVEFVSAYAYLGVTFTVTAATFSRHVRERRAKAIAAIRLLPSPRLLSLETAIKIFMSKIAPMATYGIPQCWSYLKISDFQAIDGVLMCFLRMVIGVSRFARSRLVLTLTGARLITECLVRTFQLPLTQNYLAYLDQWEEKLASVDTEFLDTPAMLDQGWATSLADNRSVLCRHSIHGFHHKFCVNEAFHEADENCVCRYCAAQCQQYHALRCPESPVTSILQLT
jgi:hypothetical protein